MDPAARRAAARAARRHAPCSRGAPTRSCTWSRGRRLGREHAPRIAAALARAAAAAVEPAAGLLLTGGETARAVCDRAGLTSIDLIAEVEPGVPLGRTGSPARLVVTKSGGFGRPDTLVAAVDAIKEHCAVPIAITMGDAAGIGPEIIVGALRARIRSPARW